MELYCILSNVGYFDKEWLWSISHQGDRLPKKLDRSKTPGIDVTIGALNNGVAIAAGLAMGLKIANKENDIYLVIDEDELKDEHFWQVIQYIARFNLHHCLVIVDRGNKRDRESQLYEDLCSLKQRVEVAGFYTLVIDGMNIKAINEAIEKCKTRTSQVSCIVLDSQQEQVNTLSSEFYSKKTSEMFHQKVEKTILKLQEKIERMS